jgi:hypothetical protein
LIAALASSQSLTFSTEGNIFIVGHVAFLLLVTKWPISRSLTSLLRDWLDLRLKGRGLLF